MPSHFVEIATARVRPLLRLALSANPTGWITVDRDSCLLPIHLTPRVLCRPIDGIPQLINEKGKGRLRTMMVSVWRGTGESAVLGRYVRRCLVVRLGNR